ncbi:MAG: transposase [Bdellovibrionales bacterium]|nr:transposase [Bdellovibrionales bacterium]
MHYAVATNFAQPLSMPRKLYLPNDTDAYHISARCINRQWFDIPMQEVWTIMQDYLWFIHHAFEIQIYAFVLMSNHYHLIVRQPKLTLSEGMQYFMRETSRCIGAQAGRINQTYGGRFFRSRIGSLNYFLHAYKYVYRNPVEAGLCTRVEEYPFSTLPGLLGQSSLYIPVQEDLTLFDNLESTMSWLNTAPSPESKEDVRRALRKAEMAFARPKNGRKNPLIEGVY